MTSIAPANAPSALPGGTPLNLSVQKPDKISGVPTMAAQGALGDVRRHGAPLPHVDDITRFPKDIDANMSIKRLLETAETTLRSAETSREFKRPALALKDYIKATCICVVTIKSHADYPTLQGGWGDLSRKHNSLLKRIDALHPTYEQIKKDIKLDNLRTGVVSQGFKSTVGSQDSHARSPSLDQHERNTTAAQKNRQSLPPLQTHAKTKPTIQPKPEALHGKALPNGHTRSSSSIDGTHDLLAQRLAALRGPQSSPGQDPRIKTHPLVPPRPAGPRSMPPANKLKIGIDSSVPSLPRMPDAIYSPVRGTVSDEAAKLPSSTPRGLFSRTGSSTSISSAANTPSQPAYGDSFPSPQSSSTSKFFEHRPGELTSAPSSAKASLDLTSGETITAERLYELMKARLLILILDIRSRDDFDEGHIMSTSTVCIEPDVLARDTLSCDQISESLILSPNQEQAIFDRRHEYDLVVIYDENAKTIARPPRTQSDLALVSIFRALIHLNYGRELRNPPRLLQGGIEAWVDLLGPSSLQSTSESSAKTARLQVRSRGELGRRKSKYIGKPMKPDDVKAWQETVNQDDEMIASSPSFHRTTEDFFRRFPAVPVEQESMTAPVVPPPPPPQYALPRGHGSEGISRYGNAPDAPNPPTRPDPARARPQYNGLSQRPTQNGTDGPALAPNRTNGSSDGSRQPSERQKFTALSNPGNWCYANSTLQALFASQFGRALVESDWKVKFKVPTKRDEKIPQPQLMMQILGNLFHWMSTGGFEVMKAHTLMNYSQHVTKQIRHAQVFGNNDQHDAHEFLQFMVEQMDDETNTRRDKDANVENPTVNGRALGDCADFAEAWWNKYSESHRSIIDEHFRFIRAAERLCSNPKCGDRVMDWTPETFMVCPLETKPFSLAGALNGLKEDWYKDVDCDECKQKVEKRQTTHFYRLPPVLCFVLQRHTDSINQRVDFDVDRLDMTPWGTSPPGASNTYECFAIVSHEGRDLNSGHYTCYVRAPGTSRPNRWIFFNDAQTPMEMSTNQVLSGPNQIFHRAYILLYRRKTGVRAGL